MEYTFSAVNQALLAAGKLVQPTTNTGQFLPFLQNPVTGKIVEMAKGTVVNGNLLSPLTALNPLNIPLTLGHMYQTHRGFQKVLGEIDVIKSSLGVLQTNLGALQTNLGILQTNLGILQATTACIGVGVVATAGLSAVNLRQTLKLRDDVQKLKLEVRDGFIDLKQALRSEGVEIIQHLDKVTKDMKKDMKFEQHRLEYIKAYSRFIQAIQLMKIATSIEDLYTRTVELSNVRQTLAEALAIYNSPHLLSETSAPGKLRRYECAWAIEQTICLTYQLQNEPQALKQSLSELQDKIRQDSLKVIECCKTEEELDFLFPELTRIHDHDLAALEAGKNQVDWMMSLPAEDLKLLASADFEAKSIETPETKLATVTEPPEYKFYQELKHKSHFTSLRDQLRFLMNPELRRESEIYVSEQAKISGLKTFVPANLQKASHMTVANLYWYFKSREESENQLEPTAVTA